MNIGRSFQNAAVAAPSVNGARSPVHGSTNLCALDAKSGLWGAEPTLPASAQRWFHFLDGPAEHTAVVPLLLEAAHHGGKLGNPRQPMSLTHRATQLFRYRRQ